MTDARIAQPNGPEAGAAGGSVPARGGGVRVVLVGDGAGLDGVISGDGVACVRARTPLEAIGEVACPTGGDAEAPTVVLVSPDVRMNGSLDAFLSAVRVADPDVRIVRVDTGTGVGSRKGYDAVVGPRVTAGALRRLVDVGYGDVSSLPATPPTTPAVPSDTEMKPVADEPVMPATKAPDVAPISTSNGTPGLPPIDGADLAFAGAQDAAGVGLGDGIVGDAICSASDPVGGAAATIGDGAMLASLAGTRDGLIRAGLGLIKARLGAGEVVFIDHADPDTETQPVPSVPVTSGGKRFGVLRAADASAESLVPHASWLGSWLGLRERQQVLRKSAFTDPLTGAWNRRYFDGFLEAALNRARETRRTVTVLIFDIDEFKKYNDNYGHPAGDEILIETVRALKASVRPSDRVCRIGGDEFAVIFDEPEGPRQAGSRPPESVYVLAKRVQRKIGESEFPKLGADAAGQLTISGGLAAFPWDGHDSETLLQKADDLACESKRAGKNAITLGPGAERVCRHAGDDLSG